MFSKCVYCGKEIEYNGFCCPTTCDECNKKIVKNWNSINNQQVNDYLKNNLRYGWICPQCGAVMSPDQNYCINCKGGTQTITWTCSSHKAD